MRNLGMVMVLALTTPGVASAQPQAQITEARAAFEEAENEYERGHLALALRGFQRSYRLMEGHPRRPLILYNIARCFEDLSQLREARDAYREYLESSAGEPEQRADVARRLRELDALLPDDGADDATLPDTTPEVVSTESGSPPSTTSPGGGISPIGPIVLGVGGALLIGGAVTGGLAIGARGNLTGMCTGMACPGSAEGLVSEVGTLALTADVLLFGGATVAATGLLLLLVLEEEPSNGAVAGFSCDRTGCIATVAGRFE